MPESYRIELTPLPGWPTSGVQRLRALLKAAGRAYGLRCTSAIATVPHAEPGGCQCDICAEAARHRAEAENSRPWDPSPTIQTEQGPKPSPLCLSDNPANHFIMENYEKHQIETQS